MELNKCLALITEGLNVNFTLNNNPISPREIFDQSALLPAIIRRADQLCSFCLGYGLGISFDEAPNSMLGVHVKLDDSTPNALRLMCATEIMYELIESSPDQRNVPLDNLMYD